MHTDACPGNCFVPQFTSSSKKGIGIINLPLSPCFIRDIYSSGPWPVSLHSVALWDCHFSLRQSNVGTKAVLLCAVWEQSWTVGSPSGSRDELCCLSTSQFLLLSAPPAQLKAPGHFMGSTAGGFTKLSPLFVPFSSFPVTRAPLLQLKPGTISEGQGPSLRSAPAAGRRGQL